MPIRVPFSTPQLPSTPLSRRNPGSLISFPSPPVLSPPPTPPLITRKLLNFADCDPRRSTSSDHCLVFVVLLSVDLAESTLCPGVSIGNSNVEAAVPGAGCSHVVRPSPTASAVLRCSRQV